MSLVHLYVTVYHVPGSLLSISSVFSHLSLPTNLGERYHDYPVFLRLREGKTLAQCHTGSWSDFTVCVAGVQRKDHLWGPEASGKPGRDGGGTARSRQLR